CTIQRGWSPSRSNSIESGWAPKSGLLRGRYPSRGSKLEPIHRRRPNIVRGGNLRLGRERDAAGGRAGRACLRRLACRDRLHAAGGVARGEIGAWMSAAARDGGIACGAELKASSGRERRIV